MPVLRVTTVVEAPPRTVAGVLRDADALAEALERVAGGHRITTPARLLRSGDEVSLALDGRPGPAWRVVTVTPGGTTWRASGGEYRAVLAATGSGTTLTQETTGFPRDLLTAWAEVVAARAVALRDAPVVVATALVRDGAVLAAQRSRPPEHAGRWELPGGRVEPGESEADAVVRECREELGTAVVPRGRLGTDLPIAAGVLRVHEARLGPGAPDPRALEHSALRWVGAADVAGVDWLAADRAVVGDLVEILTR